jgi:hypothetical protein
MPMKKKAAWIGVVGLVVFIGIQFVPVTRTNPPVTGDIPAPPEIKALLRNSCYDCHSQETVWPWYSRVAPVSWLVAGDVHDARKMMNFSTWADYTPIKQSVLLSGAVEEITEREMPPLPYTWMHRAARLSDPQIETLTAWMKKQIGE